MSIITSIIRNCTQTAVYWGEPVNDGFGGYTYALPVEIDCRWENRNEIFVTSSGDEVVAKSVVFLLQAVENNGYLYLGTLDSLYDTFESSGESVNPINIEGAFRIRRCDEIPMLKSSTEFLHKAYLTSKNMI